jgi:hypothetical protein
VFYIKGFKGEGLYKPDTSVHPRVCVRVIYVRASRYKV